MAPPLPHHPHMLTCKDEHVLKSEVDLLGAPQVKQEGKNIDVHYSASKNGHEGEDNEAGHKLVVAERK